MDQEREFLQAFEDHADALFRHAYFRLSDRERALELVQDAYLRAWDYLARGEGVRQYKPFLYKILNNLIIDEYRKHKSVSLDAMLEGENVTEGHFPDLRDESDDISALMSRLDAARLLTLLQDLPALYREAVTLRFIDGLSPKEIAALIEENENVVSVRIHRGLRQLRNAYERTT